MPGFSYGTDPLKLFEKWFQAAVQKQGLELASTMALATSQKAPSVRYLLFKGIRKGGFSFFTNKKSRKALELKANPRVALAFYWPQLDRQVRIEGRLKELSAQESQEYFSSRPRESRIHAWASPQSEVLVKDESAGQWGSRTLLKKRIDLFRKRFASKEFVPCPPYWGGFTVLPQKVEFWEAEPNRLHYRLRFVKTRSGWRREQLAP
jgi:pyridoxamine 5'-phosphate oxidase